MSALLLTAAFGLIAYKARARFAFLFPLGLLGLVAADIIVGGHGLEDQPFRTRLLAALAGCLAGLAMSRSASLCRASRTDGLHWPSLSLPLGVRGPRPKRDWSPRRLLGHLTSAHDRPRSRRILRLIAVERVVRGVLLPIAGVYVLTHLGADYGRVAVHVLRVFDLAPHGRLLHSIINHLHHLHAEQLRLVGLIAIGYGAIELIEGVGLWFDQLWAEYLTLTVTTLVIPFEMYELIHKPTLWKVAGIAVNVVIVLYLGLILRRRLVSHQQQATTAGRAGK